MAAPRSALSISACIILILFDSAIGAFAVDGKWSEWWEWEPCSATCGIGTRRRFRLCNNPPRSNGGADCAGRSVQEEACKVPLKCPVDGGWSDWTVWTPCSATCGEGVRSRTRECNSPPPANGGRNCVGKSEDIIICVSDMNCPRDGKWSSWGQWSPCSVTCGDEGSESRYRKCNNPPPSPDGKECAGSNRQSRQCTTPACPVNGHWSKWSEWSPCSVTCGPGVRSRWRRCDNPPPQNGGLDCNRTSAGEMQEVSCNATIVFCPVNGGWSEWGEWGKCNAPQCDSPDGLSYVMRERSCNNPYPAHRGSMCQGTFLDAGMCEKPSNCPIDGQWSEWSAWVCQRNSVTRTRKCNNPSPLNGGKDCIGEKVETYVVDEEDVEAMEVYDNLCPDFKAGIASEGTEGSDAVNSKDDDDESDNDEDYEEDYEDEEEV